jgi:hypothetical protein
MDLLIELCVAVMCVSCGDFADVSAKSTLVHSIAAVQPVRARVSMPFPFGLFLSYQNKIKTKSTLLERVRRYSVIRSTKA